MGPFLSGLLGGFLAWIATTFIAQPLLNFIALRSAAAAVLVSYGYQTWLIEHHGKGSLDGLRKEAKEIALRVRTFRATNSWFDRLILQPLGFELLTASACFTEMATAGPDTDPQHGDAIARALRLYFEPPKSNAE